MILLLSPYSTKPIHPRLYSLKKLFENRNMSYKLITFCPHNFFLNKINILFLHYFDLIAAIKLFFLLFKERKTIKLIYIQSLKYLLLIPVAKLFRKIVVYETLDNNVELFFYNLSKKRTFLKKALFVKKFFYFLDITILKFFCDKIIVNSIELFDLFRKNNIETKIIYYTSPLEYIYNKKYFAFECSFLYLGLFSMDKGALEMIKLVKKYNKKLYIFGRVEIQDSKLMDEFYNLLSEQKIILENNLSPEELSKKLKEMISINSFIGLSLIKNAHISYATQEANKDIDYLAIGLPIIGNKRGPTREKIISNCGVFFDNDNDVRRLLNDIDFYMYVSETSRNYYENKYSNEIFESNVLEVLTNEIRS
jgi:hypothetical protein